MAETGLDHSLGSDPDVQREVPRRLLALHQKANSAGLDGEGIQVWMDWEMEAMVWGVPVEISGADLWELVQASEVSLERVDGATSTQAVRPHHHHGAGSREGSQ